MLSNSSVSSSATATWLAVFCAVFIWSAIDPKDYTIWALEVLPAVIGLAVLAATFRSFPFSQLVYWLILVHAVILMVGGHYTYAEVPLFDWISTQLDQSRNNYDKVGHFAQGFVPALIARELLVRRGVVNGRWWTYFLSVCFCLAFSAFYELIEWWVALISEEAADSFLGTQGYIWDTQSDMAWALVGAIISFLLLARLQDRQMQRLESSD